MPYVRGVGDRLIGKGDIVAYPVKGECTIEMKYGKVCKVDEIKGRILVGPLKHGWHTYGRKVWVSCLDRVMRVFPSAERSFKEAVRAMLKYCDYE